MTEGQRAELKRFYLSPDYGMVCDLLEGECQRAETELLQTDPRKEDLVRFNHVRAQSFRWLFERFQKTVQFQIEQEPRTPIAEKDLVQQMLENPGKYF